MSKKLFFLLSKVLNVPLEQINDDSSPQTIPMWTSFNGYVMLDELENTFKVKFTLDEVLDVKTVSDIKRHLRNHGVELDD